MFTDASDNPLEERLLMPRKLEETLWKHEDTSNSDRKTPTDMISIDSDSYPGVESIMARISWHVFWLDFARQAE